MNFAERTAMTIQELLPPGVYPIWSPYDSDEAADVLMKALQAEQAERE